MTYIATIAKGCLVVALLAAFLNTSRDQHPSGNVGMSNLVAHERLSPDVLRTQWRLAEDVATIPIPWTETHAGIPASATRQPLSILHDKLRQSLRCTIESLMATFAHDRPNEVIKPTSRDRKMSKRGDLGSPESITARVCISCMADFTPDQVATLAKATYYNELIWLGETQEDHCPLHPSCHSQLHCSQEALVADFQIAVRWSDGTAFRCDFRLLHDPECRVWVPLLISWI